MLTVAGHWHMTEQRIDLTRKSVMMFCAQWRPVAGRFTV